MRRSILKVGVALLAASIAMISCGPGDEENELYPLSEIVVTP